MIDHSMTPPAERDVAAAVGGMAPIWGRVRWAKAGMLLLACLCLLWGLPIPLAGQSDTSAREITPAGVFRASALVDSVFVDRQLPNARVDGGDFAAYLMARLGARALPPDFGFRVTVDSTLLRIGGRIADLPPDARRALAGLVMILPPETQLEAQIELLTAGPEVARFRLRGATVSGIPVPEAFLATMLADVGRNYPALTPTGRDLLVQIPAGASIRLLPGMVALIGPSERRLRARSQNDTFNVIPTRGDPCCSCSPPCSPVLQSPIPPAPSTESPCLRPSKSVDTR
ncbi:MAG: hypothetical protein ABI587_07315 [Gemmatimonadales bacterium]